MWFRKFFVGVLLVCGVSVSLIAEDNDSIEFALLKANQYAKVAGDASKFIFEAGQSLDLGGSPLENTILNKLLSRQIESYQYMNELDIKYAKLVKEGYRQPYELSRIRQNKVEILDYIKEKRKTYTTKDISLFQLSDGVKKILGVSLDVIGIGLDAYSFNQNINKLIDEDGNVLVNSLGISQNVYGMVSGSVSLLSKVAKDGVIASSKFGKFFTNASKGFNRTNYIVMTLQLNSVAYSYFRDKELNSAKEYAIKEYKSILGFRKDIYSQLLTAYTNDSNISRGEIGTILSKYPIFRPNNSVFLETIILSKVFHKNISNPIYLKKRFDIDSESDLTGFQRVVVALDSLAHINLYEDDDFVRRLTKMMDAFPDDNWLAGLENAVAGAFSGADAYKIFSISDLKKKFIPSELVRDSNIDAYTFYKAMYYNIFRGDIASAWMQTANDIGKVASDFIETSIKEEEISNNTPKLLLTLPNGASIENNQIKANQGDTISFYPDITAGSLRECISNAGEGATYTLGYYETNNQANKKSLLLDFDSSTQTFSFTMPSSEIALLDLYYGSGDTTQSCGVVSVSANSNNTGNGQNTLNDVEWIQKIKAKDYIDGNYNYGHCDIGKVVMTDSLGNVFVSGNTLGGLDGNNTQNGNELIFLGKFTANGEKLWIKQYGRVGEHYEVHSMIIDSDDNIYISGWIGFGGMDARPLLYKFDKNGILLWKNELPINYEAYESQNEIQLLENGIILVSGKSGNQLEDKNHIVIRKFSFNGNLLWTKNIKEDKNTYFKAITTDNKNSYILGNKLLDSTPGNIIYEPIVYKVDSNGNQLNKTVLDTNQSIVVNNITLYKNDFYLIGLEHLEGNNYTHHLFKMDIDGKTIWRTELNKEQKYNYYGNSLEIYNDIIYSIGAKAVWLSKYTLNGTLLESKNYLPLADVMSGVGGEALTVGLDDEVYIVGNGKDKSSSNGYSSLLFKVSNDTRSSKIGQNINLISETQLDNTIVVDSFTKEWRFSQDISGLTISVLGNSYQNSVTGNNFIKDGQILKVNLTPNQSSFQNKLTLQFIDTNGNLVKVNGSETFWSLTKTNHAPRLADGQITQLVSSSSEPAFLEIATYDSDGDSVTLSVEESAGGTVTLNGNRVTASFSDGEVAHTIKIGLSDGKEKVIKAFTVLQFNQNAIENFYSDVDTNSSDYAFEGIAFGTLNGVIGGQVDPNDSSKRIFRPTDSASLAEALKMIINAEAKAGLIELATADTYMQSYPTWAMKYYTFARESGAMDKEILDLSTVYPTREAIARMLVKTLDLDSKIEAFGELNFAFSDEDEFSDAQMRYYGEIAHVFGLFMLDDQAKPQAQISRAELAGVIQRIFMIPKAELLLNPVSVEQGEGNITATLNSVVAQDINSSNYELYSSSDEVTVAVTSNSQRLSNPVDSEVLNIGENSIYAFIDNHGVRGVTQATVNISFSDQDSDGIQDRDDQWDDDTRYAYDDNGNGIPDILDLIYNLDEYDSNDTVVIEGKEVVIGDVVRDGGVVQEESDDNNSDGAWATVSLDDNSSDFNDIQSALDSNRTKILIKNGNYKLTRGLELTRDGVEVVGESVEGVVIEPADSSVCVDLFYVGGDYVTVSDITLRQNADCNFTVFVSANHHHITLKDSKVIGSDGMFAIYFAGPTHSMGQEPLDMLEGNRLDHHNQVINNVIESNFDGDVLSFSLQKDGLVRGNTIDGGLIALFLDRNVTCENNILHNPIAQGIFLSLPSYDVIIRNNTILNPASTGITVKIQTDHMDEHGEALLPDSYRSSGIWIVGNRVENARNHGIAINNLENSVIRDNVVDSPDFNGIYLYYSDNIYVAKNRVVNAGMVAAGEREALYSWNTEWDSGVYLEQHVTNSVISLNTIESANSLMQWGVAINHHWDGNQGNKIYWNHLIGNFQHEKVHVEAGTPNSKYENEMLERTGQDIWVQIGMGRGVVVVDDIEHNQSTHVELSEIGSHTIKAIADENSKFLAWGEPIECEGSECTVDNATLLDVVALFKRMESSSPLISHKVELKRDGWNLIAVCQNMNISDMNLTDIEEIQSQDGKTLYTGEWANYSNLEILEAGYGYWVKGKVGVEFDVGVAVSSLQKPLQRDGWNLMASCEERSSDVIDMTGIKEIQAQNGESIYTGEWSNYSNLDRLLNGYGYWIEGSQGESFISKE